MPNRKDIDALVKELVMTDPVIEKQKIVGDIHAMAKSRDIFLSSIHDLYKARGENKFSGFTVPAINLRSMTYDLARAIFRVAKKINAGAFIFELAKSEMGYTNQPPIEYTGAVLAAALKEDYHGPVFIQGDHCQIKPKMFALDAKKEVAALKQLIEDAVAAGFYNIDVDTSTIVDLDKKTVKEQQKDNYEVCARITEFIREIEPQGMTISIGGEIGEVGGKNSTIEELEAFMDGYLESLATGTEGMSKISIQTGTSHGGVVLPDGSIAQVNVDFDTLARLSKHAREKYRLGGAVQHGASTLPASAFGKFAECEAVEIHLATQFQNMLFDSTRFPKDLKEKMYHWVKGNCPEERKEGQTEDQFIYKARKRALGPFKKDIMNMPDDIRDAIAAEIEAKFDFLFKQLKVANTSSYVKTYIKPKDVKLGTHRVAHAILDGEGDD